MEEQNMKKEMIVKLGILQDCGIELTKSYNLNDSLEDMENELVQIKTFIEIQKIIDKVFSEEFNNFATQEMKIDAVKEMLNANKQNITVKQMNKILLISIIIIIGIVLISFIIVISLFFVYYNQTYNGPLVSFSSIITPENTGALWKVRVNSGFNINFAKIHPSIQKVLPLSEIFKNSLPAIIGGTEVQPNELPFMVSLGVMDNGSYFHFCGGTIINPYWILTAAHCAQAYNPNQILVRSSVTNLSQNQGNTNTVINSFVHPKWDANNPENGYDVGLLQLATPINGTPINLAQNDNILNTGFQFLCAGWGVTTPDPNDQEMISSTLLLQVSLPFLEVYNGNILILDGNSNANICFGDSGGPALAQINGEWTQYGITSFTESNCTSISGWTKITSVLGFIKSYVPFDFFDSGWQNSGNSVSIPAVNSINYNIIPETLDNSQWIPPNIISNVVANSDKTFTLNYTAI